MKQAIRAADMSTIYGDYCIGAVLSDGKTVHAGFNRVQTTPSPLAHAECDAIRTLTEEKRTKYLPGWTLYTTHEPCFMCWGAIYWAGIKRVRFGITQQDLAKFGARHGDSHFKWRSCPVMGHQTTAEFVYGQLAAADIDGEQLAWKECGKMLVDMIKRQKHAKNQRTV